MATIWLQEKKLDGFDRAAMCPVYSIVHFIVTAMYP